MQSIPCFGEFNKNSNQYHYWMATKCCALSLNHLQFSWQPVLIFTDEKNEFQSKRNLLHLRERWFPESVVLTHYFHISSSGPWPRLFLLPCIFSPRNLGESCILISFKRNSRPSQTTLSNIAHIVPLFLLPCFLFIFIELGTTENIIFLFVCFLLLSPPNHNAGSMRTNFFVCLLLIKPLVLRKIFGIQKALCEGGKIEWMNHHYYIMSRYF